MDSDDDNSAFGPEFISMLESIASGYYQQWGLPRNFRDWTSEHKRIFDAIDKHPLAMQSNFGRDKVIVMTREDAIKQAKSRSATIFNSFSTLQSILERFEDLVRRRWSKKTRAQRKALLLEAWPNMPEKHRPDIQAYRHEDEMRRKSNTDFRDAYMWPHISLQDLLSGSTTMRLLNSRGRHEPRFFARMDLESIHLGRRSKALPYTYITVINFVIDMENTAEKYGAIVDSPSARFRYADGVFRGERIVPSEALQVLEIQERILEFLVKLCKDILHDKSLEDPCVAVLPEPPPLVANTEELSAAAIAMSASYGVPQKVDLSQIRSLVQARLSDAQDHHWALREDPAYFADCVGEWAEHALEMILDKDRKPRPGRARPLKKDWFWDRTITEVIVNSYESIFLWRFIEQQLGKIIRLDTEYGGEKSASEYVNEARRLKFILDCFFKPIILRKLYEFFAASPPMRSLFYVAPDPDETEVTEQPWTAHPRTTPDSKDDIMWVLKQTRDARDLETCGFETLSHEFERLLGDNSQRKRISAQVARVVADVGLVGELRNQLRIYIPIVFSERGNQYLASRELKDFLESSEEFIRPVMDLAMIGFPGVAKFLELGFDGDPTSNKFYYPVSKQRTKQNHEAMQQAEINLDELWIIYDIHIFRTLERPIYLKLQDLIPKGRKLLRMEDWVEPQEATESATKKLATFSLDFGERDDKIPSYKTAAPKTKVKTKRVNSSPGGPDEQHEPVSNGSADSISHQQHFVVNKRAFKTFSTIFYKPSSHTQPGEIPWTDFLYAMNGIGFASRKLYGSVWQFTPVSLATSAGDDGQLDANHSIHFHEPHPHSKFSFRVARRYGRRLTRTYGISGSSFSLARVSRYGRDGKGSLGHGTSGFVRT